MFPKDFAGWKCLSAGDSVRIKCRIAGDDPMTIDVAAYEDEVRGSEQDGKIEVKKEKKANAKNKQKEKRKRKAKEIEVVDVVDDLKPEEPPPSKSVKVENDETGSSDSDEDVPLMMLKHQVNQKKASTEVKKEKVSGAVEKKDRPKQSRASGLGFAVGDRVEAKFDDGDEYYKGLAR